MEWDDMGWDGIWYHDLDGLKALVSDFSSFLDLSYLLVRKDKAGHTFVAILFCRIQLLYFSNGMTEQERD